MSELRNYAQAFDELGELCYVEYEFGELGEMIELWNCEHELGDMSFSII